MAVEVQGGRNAWRTARRCARVFGLAVLLVVALTALIPSSSAAQDSPASTASPHWITAPSLPVRGPRVLRTLPPPGVIEPTPGVEYQQHEHLVGIAIDGEGFRMPSGTCAFRVEAAILAHDDVFTGDQACDSLIRQARAIQRRRETEDPAYANAPRITPAPTQAESGDDKSHQ
jgi:hypothetical protein